MEERKSFFASLNPRSALIVGLVTGILVICTIGFVVLLVLKFSGVRAQESNGTVAVNTEQTDDAIQQPVEEPTPAPPKAKRPSVEVFVMAYCPYGLQMQKAMLPVMELLKDKAGIVIRFVSYAMHGQQEVEENTRQYCIQKEQSGTFVNYLKCFTNSGDSVACAKQSGVNESKMKSCVSATDKKFGTMVKFNDKSTWLNGRYPVYPVDSALNDKYGVQGSPTVVINGEQINVGRSPEAAKKAICAAFETAPSECEQTLSAVSANPGLEKDNLQGGSAGGCATN